MIEWNEYELSQLIYFSNDKISRSEITRFSYVSTNNMVNNTGGILPAENVPDSLKFNKFNSEDILFSNIRTYFKKVWFAEFTGGCSADVLVIKNKDKRIITNRFLFLLLITEEFINYTVRTSKGTKMPRGDKDAILKYKVIIPSEIKYQRIIENILFDLFKKISLNNCSNNTLEQISQAIFKSWFVDFDPVTAKEKVLLAGGSQDEAIQAAMEVISGKNADELKSMETEEPGEFSELQQTAELFPSSFVDSELGRIPEGWGITPYIDTINIISGGTPKKSEPSFWNGDICWFSIKDCPSDGNVFVVDTEEKITSLGLRNSSIKILPQGTTIIPARDTVGKLTITGVDTSINQSCYGIQGKSENDVFFNYLNLKHYLKQCVHAAVFDTVTRESFKEVKTLNFCNSLKELFERRVCEMFDHIKINVIENITLKNIKDHLLPKLLSGEISLESIDLESLDL